MVHRIACVGLGGYAANYIRAAQKLRDEGRAEIVAVAEVHLDRFGDLLAELTARGTRVYTSFDDLLAAERDIDLVTIGTGVHLHCPMALQALARGAHVLTAKPSTTLIQNVDRMAEAAERAGRILAVDFQHVYAEATQEIKAAISAGTIGRVEAVVARLAWCRTQRYYERNNWAGRYMLGDEMVLDGPLNNPHAHYIQNALYFAGAGRHSYAAPAWVQAELYKGHDIEGEDTVSARAVADTGVEILFLATLCAEEGAARTEIDVYAEGGSAYWSFDHYRIAPREGEPIERPTGKVTSEVVVRHVLECIETGDRPLVRIEDTRGHVLFSNGAYESARAIRRLSAEHLRVERLPDGDVSTEIVGINALIQEAGERRALFSELGAPWARASRPFRLAAYRTFRLAPPDIAL